MKHLNIMMLLVFLTVVSLNAQNKDKDIRALVQQKVVEGKKPVPVQGGVAFLNDNTIDIKTEDGHTLSISYTGAIDRLHYNHGLAVAEEKSRELQVDHMKLRVFSGENNAEIYKKTVEAQPYASLNDGVIFTEARTYAEWDGFFKVIYLSSGKTVIPEFAKGQNFQATPIDGKRILILVRTSERYMTEKFGSSRRTKGVKIYIYDTDKREKELITTLDNVNFKHPGVGAVHFVKKASGELGFLLIDITSDIYFRYKYYEVYDKNVQLIDTFQGILGGVFYDSLNTYSAYKENAEDEHGYIRNLNDKTTHRVSTPDNLIMDIGHAGKITIKNSKLLVPVQNSVNKHDERSPHILKIDLKSGDIGKANKTLLFNRKEINY